MGSWRAKLFQVLDHQVIEQGIIIPKALDRQLRIEELRFIHLRNALGEIHHRRVGDHLHK